MDQEMQKAKAEQSTKQHAEAVGGAGVFNMGIKNQAQQMDESMKDKLERFAQMERLQNQIN